ncbi:hypothetical protein SESBI_46889 [Sesbania bispinosa]|nr:hypothetical protein SESBI_46889 [Sesbania bispinosa]
MKASRYTPYKSLPSSLSDGRVTGCSLVMEVRCEAAEDGRGVTAVHDCERKGRKWSRFWD